MANIPNRDVRRSRPGLRNLGAALAVVTTLCAGAAWNSQARADSRAGYLTTSDGTPVIGESACVHTDEWGPGMHYRRCDPSAKLARTAPNPVRVAAKVNPTVPAAPPLPVPFKLAVDTLFGFDRIVLKPEGRALLHKLADRIGRADFGGMEIVGHADRIGSDSYNQLLSERRAGAVRDYLVARGLDSQKLSARGVGTSEPATLAGECSGLRGVRLKDCLQPDRYVEIKTQGTTPTAALSRAILELEPKGSSV
jgi:OOP family OmpA-OmpF porin